MGKRATTFVNALLIALYGTAMVAGTVAEILIDSRKAPYRWAYYGSSYRSYRQNIYQLERRGLVKVISKDGKKFLKLTAKGELEALLAKAKLPTSGKWDGKWRLIIFDIPEDARPQRHTFRKLLKQNNFYKLQASVYVSPHPLNREAIVYLQQTGLMKYIRIIKVEEMDNDKDLRKKFSVGA